MAIYTMKEANDIVEIFDDFLCARGIKVPSDDDEQRGAENEVAIYGMDYAELLSDVERVIIDIVNRARNESAVTGVWES